MPPRSTLFPDPPDDAIARRAERPGRPGRPPKNSAASPALPEIPKEIQQSLDEAILDGRTPRQIADDLILPKEQVMRRISLLKGMLGWQNEHERLEAREMVMEIYDRALQMYEQALGMEKPNLVAADLALDRAQALVTLLLRMAGTIGEEALARIHAQSAERVEKTRARAQVESARQGPGVGIGLMQILQMPKTPQAEEAEREALRRHGMLAPAEPQMPGVEVETFDVVAEPVESAEPVTEEGLPAEPGDGIV